MKITSIEGGGVLTDGMIGRRGFFKTRSPCLMSLNCCQQLPASTSESPLTDRRHAQQQPLPYYYYSSSAHCQSSDHDSALRPSIRRPCPSKPTHWSSLMPIRRSFPRHYPLYYTNRAPRTTFLHITKYIRSLSTFYRLVHEPMSYRGIEKWSVSTFYWLVPRLVHVEVLERVTRTKRSPVYLFWNPMCLFYPYCVKYFSKWDSNGPKFEWPCWTPQSQQIGHPSNERYDFSSCSVSRDRPISNSSCSSMLLENRHPSSKAGE